jgi:hypothetical protein
MTKTLKPLSGLVIILILISCKPNNTGFVKIRHIGACDKYIANLIFVKTDTTTHFEIDEFVKVSEKSFDYITDYLIKNKTNTEFDNYSNKYGDYGTFRIIILTKDNLKDTITTRERRNSYIFFRKFNQYLIDNKVEIKVTKTIQEEIIKRVECPAPGFPEK